MTNEIDEITVINKLKALYSPEPVLDITQESEKNSLAKVLRYQASVEYGHKQSAIRNRYLNQRYWGENLTPKQKRRMRKQNAKWRKRILGA